MNVPYDQTYSPPIPAIDIVLSLPEGDRVGPLSAVIDTGADATIIPLAVLAQLSVRPFQSGFLRSAWGERRPIDLYLLDLQIAGLTVPGVEVVGDNLGRELILGRNVLNQLILLLDGPAHLTTVSSR
jgi:predicted aspartyl protease